MKKIGLLAAAGGGALAAMHIWRIGFWELTLPALTIQWARVIGGLAIAGAGAGLFFRPRLNHLMTLIILVFGVYSIFWGEHITINSGLGADGVIFVEILKNFPGAIFKEGLNYYYLQRVLPIGIVYGALSLLQLPLKTTYILIGYHLYNLLLLAAASYVWGRIMDWLELGVKGKWLAFAGLFVNFAILKAYFYTPVFTDQTAFVLGVLQFYFFLADKSWPLLITSVAGAFVWPSLLPMGLLLYVFSPVEMEAHAPERRHANKVAAWLIGGMFLVAIIKYYYIENLTPGIVGYSPEAVPLAIVAAVIVAALASQRILDDARLFQPRSLRRAIDPRRAAIGCLAFAGTQAVILLLSASGGNDPAFLFSRLVLISIAYPALPFVSHAVYLGPFLILTLYWWRPFCRLIHQRGIGLTLFVLVGTIFGIVNSESRHLINVLPVFVAFTAKIAEGALAKPSHYWLIGVVNLLFSKVWLPINVADPSSDIYYSMNFGPWMAWQWYAVQGGAVILAAFLFYFIISRAGAVDHPAGPMSGPLPLER